MFDLTTIITLIAPAVVAPLVCLVALRALARSERGRAPTPHVVATFTRSSPEPPVAPVAERQAA